MKKITDDEKAELLRYYNFIDERIENNIASMNGEHKTLFRLREKEFMALTEIQKEIEKILKI